MSNKPSKALREKWDKVLKENPGELSMMNIGIKPKIQQKLIVKQRPENTDEYEFLEYGRFKTKMEKAVWALHCEHLGYRKICAKLHLPHNKVRTLLQELIEQCKMYHENLDRLAILDEFDISSKKQEHSVLKYNQSLLRAKNTKLWSPNEPSEVKITTYTNGTPETHTQPYQEPPIEIKQILKRIKTWKKQN